MDDSTKTMMLAIGTGIAKKLLLGVGAAAASHGLIAGNQIETFVSVGMVVVGMGWSFWNDYGRAIVLSKLEVLKAQSLAQAAKLRNAGVSAPTVAEIAAQHPTLKPADITKAADIVVKVLIAAFLLSAFLPSGSAVAQGHKVKSLKQVGDDFRNAIDAPASTMQAGLQSLLSKPMQDLADFIQKGFDDAVDLSTAVPELQDGNGQACWGMMKNYSVILKKHPIPVTMEGSFDLEAIRLLNMAANKICQNSACTQVFTEAGNLINAASPIPMALPNLTALCSKVPDIAVVAPIAPAPQASVATSATPITSTTPLPPLAPAEPAPK